MTQVIQIRRRVSGPGAPAVLALAELAFNTSGDELYIGVVDGSAHVLVGADRQVELAGDQTFQVGAKKTIYVGDLKLLGGANGYFLTTDGDGNLTFAAAVAVPASLIPVSPPVAGGSDVQAALQGLQDQIDALSMTLMAAAEAAAAPEAKE